MKIAVHLMPLFKVEYRLVLLTIPPHCVHILQLLDSSVMRNFETMLLVAFSGWEYTNTGQTLAIYNLANFFNKAYIVSFTRKILFLVFLKHVFSLFDYSFHR